MAGLEITMIRRGDSLARFHDSYTEEPNTGCFLWTKSLLCSGYGSFFDGRKNVRAHRYALSLVVELSEKDKALHKCDTPSCVNPDHLFVGTQADNIADMIQKKRNAYGSRSPLSKLDEDQVAAIRASNERTNILAKRYGVSAPTISGIRCSTKHWRHVLAAK